MPDALLDHPATAYSRGDTGADARRIGAKRVGHIAAAAELESRKGKSSGPWCTQPRRAIAMMRDQRRAARIERRERPCDDRCVVDVERAFHALRCRAPYRHTALRGGDDLGQSIAIDIRCCELCARAGARLSRCGHELGRSPCAIAPSLPAHDRELGRERDDVELAFAFEIGRHRGKRGLTQKRIESVCRTPLPHELVFECLVPTSSTQHDDVDIAIVVDIGHERLVRARGARLAWKAIGKRAERAVAVVGNQHTLSALGHDQHVEIAVVVGIEEDAITCLT